jgi:hypothetical protein
VYRPIYRGGIVYNYGMPRDRVVKIIRRPIYVQKIYKVDHWKGGKFDRDGRNKGIKIYAPNFNRDGRNRGPKKFVDNPKDFKPKAKLHDTFKGDVPKGWGKSAKGLTPIAKEDPEGFKKKKPGRFDGHDQDFGDRGKDKDRDKDRDRDNDKNQAKGTPPPINKVIRDQNGVQGGTVGDTDEKGDSDGRGKDKDKGKGQASKDFDRDGKQGRKGKDGTPPPPPAPPPVVKGATGDGDIRTQTERGTLRQQDDKDNAKNKNKNKNQNFGNQGGPDQFKQGKRDDDQGGGGGQRKQKTFGDQGGGGGGGGGQGGERAQGNQGGGGGGDKKKEKCQKNPDHPSCQN